MKPYLFIDVDGVLNPDKPSRHHRRYEILDFTVYLSNSHGTSLRNLSKKFDLVWATTWQNLANKHIAPKIGIDALPYVTWSVEYPNSRFNGPMIKTIEIVDYANGRPFAWIDDEIEIADRRFIIDMDCYCFPLRINPRTGLSASDIRMVDDWGSEAYAKTAQANTT